MRHLRRLAAVLVVLSAVVFPTAALAESEPNDSIAQADPVGIGYTNGQVNVRLSSGSDVDFYKFTTAANRTYVIETYNIQGRPDDAATGLWLYNASGTLLANDAYGSRGTGTTNARLTFTFVQAGTYYIEVDGSQYDSSWAGTYSLRVLPKFSEPGAAWNTKGDHEPNDTIDLANQISLGYENGVTRQLFDYRSFVTGGPDQDFYRFAATAGRTYVIETFNIQGQPDSAATGLWLYSASGSLVANDAYGSKGTGATNARIVFTATATANYFIEVGSSQYGAWVGTYALRVLAKFNEPGASWNTKGEHEPNDTREIANAIGLGYQRAVTRQLFDYRSFVTGGPDQDFYYFLATAGRTYVIETFNIQGRPDDAATSLWLYSASGSRVADDGYGSEGSGNANARIVFTATATANYFIEVGSSLYGAWVGTYSLRVLPKYDEPGAAWNAANDYEPNDTIETAYQINVGPATAQSHRLFPHDSYVTGDSDLDFYRFTARAGRKYIIQTYNVPTDSDGTGLWLYSETGSLLASDPYGSADAAGIDAEITFTFSSSGTYFVLVRDSAWYSSWAGQYTLRVCEQNCNRKLFLPVIRRR